MKNLYIIIVLIGLLIANPVVTINNIHYSVNDFYQEYSKKEWELANKDQRKEFINDFINRKTAVLEAKNIGFENKPDITI